TQSDFFRAATLWVQNDQGEVLIQKRSDKVQHNPGTYGSAAGGTVDEGGTYEETVIRESEEEIGLTGIHPKLSLKRLYNGNCFTQWFEIKLNMDITEFTLDPDEVAELKWFELSQLQKMVKDNSDNFMPHLIDRINNSELFNNL
ncbi:MAG: NUDIX hydrolase, partial [Patescibacteria group bacterium]